jgi:opacity protein-like surface antigen
MKAPLTMIALLFAASVADADTGLYIGAGIDRTTAHNIYAIPPCDQLCSTFHINDTSWKAILGWRPLKLFALEGEYVDLGSSAIHLSHGNANYSANATAVYAIGFLPLPVPMFDVYGKLGAARWEVDGHSYTFSPRSDQGHQFTFGAGAQVHPLPRVGVRFEYEHFNVAKAVAIDVQAYSLGVTYDLP